jgi:VWFA-related protein
MSSKRVRIWSLALALAGVTTAGAQQPTFKSRVDLVTVDVTVLDSKGNPMTGLGRGDFTLRVDGQPRTIASVDYVTYAPPAAATEPTARGVADDVRHVDGRVLVVAVDQRNIRRVEGGAALEAARQFIDTLGPADRVAAIGLDATGPIEFTADHARVKRELGDLRGRAVAMPTEFPIGISEALGVADGSRGWLDRVVTRVCGQPLARVQRMERMAAEEGMRDPCPTHVEQQARALAHSVRHEGAQSVDAVKHLLRRLNDIEGPKTLVLVSEGLIAEPRLVDMTDVALLAQQARVTIYVVQPDVPAAEAGEDMLSPTTADDVRARGDGLARLAGVAGGTLLQLVGSDPHPFRRVLRETSGYYLLSFEPAPQDRDGATHRIAVDVGRPAVTVRARPVFAIGPPPTAPLTVEDQLVQLLRSRRVATALPLALSVSNRLAADGEAIATSVAVELETGPADVTYGAVVVDGKGIVVTSATARTTTGRFAFAKDVAPGRYLVRVAAVEPLGQAGTIERTLDVQLHGAAVRASDLLLTTPSSAGGSAPVVARTSTSTIDVALDVYAPDEWRLEPADAAFELRSATGEPIRTAAGIRKVDASRWVLTGRFDVGDLPAGRYIVSASVPGVSPPPRSFLLVR